MLARLLLFACCGVAALSSAAAEAGVEAEGAPRGLDAMSASEWRESCPKDNQRFCLEKARAGGCFDGDERYSAAQKYCPCSCAIASEQRINTCCRALGSPDMAFCLPYCKYNKTEELSAGQVFKCVGQLGVWSYCANDAADNADCCRRLNVPTECLEFCRGNVPTCDLEQILEYEPCLYHLDAIMTCARGGLEPQKRWNPDWHSTCP